MCMYIHICIFVYYINMCAYYLAIDHTDKEEIVFKPPSSGEFVSSVGFRTEFFVNATFLDSVLKNGSV